jgi:splicing factor 3B subunit 4
LKRRKNPFYPIAAFSPIYLQANKEKRNVEVGANLFIGGLDQEVDDKLLHDTFAAFGGVLNARVMVDANDGKSKGIGFVNFDNFDSADMGTLFYFYDLHSCQCFSDSHPWCLAAIAAMNGQFLCGSQVQVQFAYKKEGVKGERHGSAAGS